MGPFDRFNDRAKRVLALAQDEAIRLGHRHLGSEHLLLGLVREGEGVAARALDALGVKLAELRRAVESRVPRAESPTAPSEVTLTPRAKKIIELAIEESRALGHSHVGTEHLLLGLVREGEGVAADALTSLGVSLEKLRQQVIATIGQQHGSSPLPGRFGQASEGIQRTMTVAAEEALALGHDWVGSEHMLLAILKPALPHSAVALLATQNVTHETALAAVLAAVPRKEGRPKSAALTPRAQKIVGYANGYADALPTNDATAALLVALLREEDGVAAKVLRGLGASPQRLGFTSEFGPGR